MQNYHREGCNNHNFQFNNRICNKELMRSFKSRINDYAISRKTLSVFAKKTKE